MMISVFLFFLVVPLSLFLMGVWIWSLVDCLTRPDDTLEPSFGSVSPKPVWALIIFFAGIIGTIIYIFVAGTKKAPKRGAPPSRPAADSDEVRRILEMIARGTITAADGQRLLATLGTTGAQAATAQPSPASPMRRGLMIGCLLLILVPLLLLVAFFFMRAHAMARSRQEMSMHQTQWIEEQVQRQRSAQLGENPLSPVQATVTRTMIITNSASTNPE